MEPDTLEITLLVMKQKIRKRNKTRKKLFAGKQNEMNNNNSTENEQNHNLKY